jgi:hypothetical protein
MPQPKLTFFTELDSERLTDLFNDSSVIKSLQELDASVSLGILDLSDGRAKVVRKLNKAKIPVIAWLLLPKEEGYWFNTGNYRQATARYADFIQWTQAHKLHWAGIGLDIEMDINEFAGIMDQEKASHNRKLAKTLFQRYRDRQRAEKARLAYQALVDQIHADGYLVESYQLPVINEERRARSTVLGRTVGLVNVQTDREVLMLYSSFLRPNGDAVLWSYAPETDSVGVGNTGGGVEVKGVIDVPPLTWEEFSRDLRLCVAQQKPIHIFCLEGCVAQGFLPRLLDFDWDEPVSPPSGAVKVRTLRTGLATGLWLLERPWVILLSLAGLLSLGFLFKQSQKKK